MEYPESIYERLDAVSAQVKTSFSTLDASQLNWQAEPGKWGVGLCLRHLITTNESYFPTLDALAKGSFRPSIWSKIPGAPAYFGKLILKMVSPETRTQKGKSPKAFRPRLDPVRENIVSIFLQHQEILKSKLKAIEKTDHQKVIINSPAAFFLTYSLYHTLHIFAAHEERHLLQALEVVEQPKFPHTSHV